MRLADLDYVRVHLDASVDRARVSKLGCCCCYTSRVVTCRVCYNASGFFYYGGNDLDIALC